MLQYGSFKWASYLCEVGVGVEAALIAHLAAALCTGVKVVPYAHQVGGFADRAEFAARHWGNLWYGVRGGGDTAAIGRCRGGPASPAATHIHLQALPGHMTLTMFSLRLIGVMGGQPVPRPMTTLHARFRTWVWQGWSGRENGKNSSCYSCAVTSDSSTYIYISTAHYFFFWRHSRHSVRSTSGTFIKNALFLQSGKTVHVSMWQTTDSPFTALSL